jgi:hypothetical protein
VRNIGTATARGDLVKPWSRFGYGPRCPPVQGSASAWFARTCLAQQAGIAGLRIAAGQIEMLEQPRHLEDAVKDLRAMVEV